MWRHLVVVLLVALGTSWGQQDDAPPVLEPSLTEAALRVAHSLQSEDVFKSASADTSTARSSSTPTLVIRRSKATGGVPKPVYVTSIPLVVKGQASVRKQGRKLEVDGDGVPVIHGVRMPDDESDRFVWRNARVIDGKLVTNKGTVLANVASLLEGKERSSRSQSEPFGAGQIQARILYSQPFNASDRSYLPTSTYGVYQQDITTPSRIAYEESVRPPVVHYAHPDYGTQPSPSSTQQSAYKPVYFTRDNPQDIHNDRSPYAFEPADLAASAATNQAGAVLPTPVKSQRPKKTLPNYYQQSLDSYTNKYKRYPYSYNPYGYSATKDQYRYKLAPPASLAQPAYSSYYPTSVYGDPKAPGYQKYLTKRPHYYPVEEKSFWEQITEKIQEHLQLGMNRVTSFTRPVVDPLMEASKKISHNLGFSRQLDQASEKVSGLAGSTTLILPALGLVAGGAALGLGAVAVGRYMDEDIMKRANEDILKRSNEESKVHSVSRRSIDAAHEDEFLENILHSLEENQEVFLSKLSRYGPHGWKETPCAKRIFCDVMVQQPSDAVVLMEKKMATFLSLVNQDVARALSYHLNDVMDAVRNHDCSSFACTGEEVDLAHLESRGRGLTPR